MKKKSRIFLLLRLLIRRIDRQFAALDEPTRREIVEQINKSTY